MDVVIGVKEVDMCKACFRGRSKELTDGLHVGTFCCLPNLSSFGTATFLACVALFVRSYSCSLIFPSFSYKTIKLEK